MALDALTYAGVRENVDGIDGVTFVHADIGDTDRVAGASWRATASTSS